jgi:uncharacterized protein (DUF2336 family)
VSSPSNSPAASHAEANLQDEATRVRLGASTATAADVLLTLAADPSVTVRAALALNPAAPPTTFDTLARDADERVRALLAHRLASLAPNLDNDAQSRLREQAFAALAHLVEDEAIRVRSAIAEAVKEMPNAPRELVLRLARDTALPVSEEVIRLSPVLTQADLLSLLATAASSAVALAVARRPGLTEAVADAIAASADTVAIRALLENHSAQIRESTLDALIALAANCTSWHGPLVRRPNLSPRAAQALSEIVADTLLAELTDRADLGPAATAELRARLSARLTSASTPQPPSEPTRAEALSEARARAFCGRLTETELLAVTGRGESQLAAAMLAVAAGVPLATVERAAFLRSSKGLVSLVWKAGFSMKTAVPVQRALARLGPASLLTCGPGGTFPLSIEEMRWQIAFLRDGE